MNKVILMGRLTADPEVRYGGADNTCVARYTLAVDRRYNTNNGEREADFIRCVAFGRNGEFVEKYLRKGMKIAVVGRIQTGKYTNQEGKTVYTTDVVVEEHDFAEGRSSQSGGYAQGQQGQQQGYGYSQGNGYANNPAQTSGYGNAAATPQSGNGGNYQNSVPAQNGYNGGYQNTAPMQNYGGFNQAPAPTPNRSNPGDGFMNIPDGIDEELPFN